MNGKTTGNLVLMTAICIVIFWMFMALRPASAQAFIGGSGNLGRSHGYVSSPVGTPSPPPLTPKQVACYRANYHSTFAMQRCSDEVQRSWGAGSKMTRCLNAYARTNQL